MDSKTRDIEVKRMAYVFMLTVFVYLVTFALFLASDFHWIFCLVLILMSVVIAYAFCNLIGRVVK